ncbi:hypothetical protein [Vibrio cholerae]|uniref:hypothetical protein n=1 Tax=Vibrio cholerae TaxID=666 RepID=UPI003080391B
MYFYNHIQNGQEFITGPYLLGVNALLKGHENAKGSLKLKPEELEILTNTQKELGIYGVETLGENSRLIIRQSFSNIEYRAIFAKFSESGYSVEDWTQALGVTPNVHKNLLLGRTSLDTLQSRQIANMCLAHSYLQEVSALYLAGLNAGQKPIAQFNYEEFGKMSLKLLHTLKASKNIALRYYWGQRTHIDVCSLFPVIERVVNQSKNSPSFLIDTFMKTAEWASLTAEELKPQSSAGLKLDKSEKAQVLEYLKLVRDSSSLTVAQHQRLMELAISVSAIATDKGVNPHGGGVQEAIVALMGGNETEDTTKMEMLNNLEAFEAPLTDEELSSSHGFVIDI